MSIFELARVSLETTFDDADLDTLSLDNNTTGKVIGDLDSNAIRDLNHWIRFTILFNKGFHAGNGGDKRLFRYLGLLVFSIFVEKGLGNQPVSEMADKITATFRAKRIGKVNTEVPGGFRTVNRIDSEDEGVFSQYEIICPFRIDDCG